MIRITECPRDAMQGIKEFIPTEIKLAYLQQLLKIGFDTLDFGSFVSPKAIPQMQDTSLIMDRLDLSNTNTRLLAIIANERGAQDASQYEPIHYLGYPFSISETFQQRNTNASILESVDRVNQIQEICSRSAKELLIYISMAFGNPYGDEWNSNIVIDWIGKLQEKGIKHFALADTIGVSNPENISYLFKNLIPAFPEIMIGAHLHSTPETAKEKIVAAYQNGCRSFDVAIHGFGGCPMAKDDLTGNLATEILLQTLADLKISHHLNNEALQKAYDESWKIFNRYH
jgi:hydroxymethylglutaryl-CoA lyase